MYCVGAYKVGGAGQCSSMRGKVSMATLWAAPTKHHHTEQFSGILTDQYLPSPYLKREQGMGKTKHKKARKQQAIATTLCEELQASNCVYL